MAFERDFVERFGEEGRTILITYHKGLKQANLDMIPIVTGLAQAVQTPRPGDQRFIAHFKTLAQREEHNNMCLIGPPDRADYELVKVPPALAAMFYEAYAKYNAHRVDSMRALADPKLVEHLDKVTHYLERMAAAAAESPGPVQLPLSLINPAYDSALAEVDPNKYDREILHPVGV